MAAIAIPGYEIERELGVGGMARVYLAIQSSLERRVALKVMAPALAADATFSKRFLREARTIASLTHANIVAVYEVGVTNDHIHYFSMQYLPGGDFAQRMRRGVSESEVVRVLSGIGKALGFAHSQGVIHRDVTPGNIMFDAADTPLLTDFGIARALSGSTRITSTGVSIGTSNYMSPEQARGGDVDARSDLYSLGALAFEALVGSPPYQGADGFAVAYAHVFEPIPRLPAKVARWQAFIDKALAKEAKDRFSSADEFVTSLASIDLSGAPSTMPATVEKPLPTLVQSTTAQIESLVRQVPPRNDKTAVPAWMMAGLTVILVAGLGAAGYGYWSSRGTTEVREDSSHAVSKQPVSQPNAQLPSQLPIVPTPMESPILDAPQDADTASQPVTSDGVTLESLEPLPSDFGPPLPQQQKATLLALGQALLKMQRLQLPPEANATLMFSRVLALDPENEEAKAGLASVVDAYIALAETELAAWKLPESRERLDRARQVAALPGMNLAELTKRIDAPWQRKLKELKDTAQIALQAWQGETALEALNLAKQLSPDDKSLEALIKEAGVIGKPGYRFRDKGGPELTIIGKGEVRLRGARRGGDVAVRIERPFAVSRHEITVGDYRRFVDATGHRTTAQSCRNQEGFFSASKDRTWRVPGYTQTDNHPVVCVGFDDALAFARWISSTTGFTYRLLSEAEWQYLASATTVSACKSGNRADQSFKAQEGGNKTLACDDGMAFAAPVGRFGASASGVYDLEGNVREWVADCANEAHAGRKSDQSARDSGDCSERVIMGSAWHSDSDEAAVVIRRLEDKSWLSNTTGFRLARDLK